MTYQNYPQPAQPKIKRVKDKQLPIVFPNVVQPSVAERKNAFLKKLASPSGKTKYKRYMGAPIRYAGGKSLAVGLILELVPDTIERLVSPFLGGGSVEVACANELGLSVIGYDIFDILVNYWQVQLEEPEQLYARLMKFSPTELGFKQVKERLKLHWTGKDPLERLDLAAYFYFNHNTSYGPHFLGWPSRVYLQPERYQTMLERVRNFRAENLQVECASFEAVMQKHRDDFLYLDPPYYLDGDSKTFVGLYPHRNFPIHHKGFKHDLLRDLIKSHRGGFILSYNDCSVIRDWYKDFAMDMPSWQQTFGQGDTRIGENRMRNNNGHYVKKSHELLIWSMPR